MSSQQVTEYVPQDYSERVQQCVLEKKWLVRNHVKTGRLYFYNPLTKQASYDLDRTLREEEQQHPTLESSGNQLIKNSSSGNPSFGAEPTPSMYFPPPPAPPQKVDEKKSKNNEDDIPLPPQLKPKEKSSSRSGSKVVNPPVEAVKNQFENNINDKIDSRAGSPVLPTSASGSPTTETSLHSAVLAALQSGEWKEKLDPKSNKTYYFNVKTRKASWNLEKTLEVGKYAPQQQQETQTAAENNNIHSENNNNASNDHNDNHFQHHHHHRESHHDHGSRSNSKINNNNTSKHRSASSPSNELLPPPFVEKKVVDENIAKNQVRDQQDQKIAALEHQLKEAERHRHHEIDRIIREERERTHHELQHLRDKLLLEKEEELTSVRAHYIHQHQRDMEDEKKSAVVKATVVTELAEIAAAGHKKDEEMTQLKKELEEARDSVRKLEAASSQNEKVSGIESNVSLMIQSMNDMKAQIIEQHQKQADELRKQIDHQQELLNRALDTIQQQQQQIDFERQRREALENEILREQQDREQRRMAEEEQQQQQYLMIQQQQQQEQDEYLLAQQQQQEARLQREQQERERLVALLEYRLKKDQEQDEKERLEKEEKLEKQSTVREASTSTPQAEIVAPSTSSTAKNISSSAIPISADNNVYEATHSETFSQHHDHELKQNQQEQEKPEMTFAKLEVLGIQHEQQRRIIKEVLKQAVQEQIEENAKMSASYSPSHQQQNKNNAGFSPIYVSRNGNSNFSPSPANNNNNGRNVTSRPREKSSNPSSSRREMQIHRASELLGSLRQIQQQLEGVMIVNSNITNNEEEKQ